MEMSWTPCNEEGRMKGGADLQQNGNHYVAPEREEDLWRDGGNGDSGLDKERWRHMRATFAKQWDDTGS